MAGFVLSCVGDNKSFSKISSRAGNTLADRMLENILDTNNIKYKNYSFLIEEVTKDNFVAQS